MDKHQVKKIKKRRRS